MLELGDTGLIVRATSPMAYLDHWAFRRFSADDRLATRLAAALHAKHGTLAVSWLNFAEYAAITDGEQRLQAERLLNRILPAIFPLDVEPFGVSEHERAGKLDPHADLQAAKLFVRNRGVTIAASGLDLRLTASGLFQPVNSGRLVASKDALARTTRGRLENLRREYARNAKFRNDVARAERHPEQAPTTIVAVTRALVSTFFPDHRRKIKTNDAIDFLHAVVPVAFCDAVLLDGATWDTVERARRKLAGIRIATTFSGRGDGVERFVAYLEAWAPAWS